MFDIDKLLNKLILSFLYNKEKEEILIKTEYKNYMITAEGECCSESWIEHIDEFPTNFIINEIELKDVGEIAPISEDESLKQYFYEFKTNKGSFTIELRNSSSGYYGGYLWLHEIK